MTMSAGRLRHRVRLERRAAVQDSRTGEMITSWTVVADKIPAEILPLSAREMMAAQSMQSEVTARVIMRHRVDIDATMRIVHSTRRGDVIYGITGVLADNKSGCEWITVPVKSGVRDE